MREPGKRPRRALAGRHGRRRRLSATILVMKSAARVRLDNRGIVTVETDMTDIGTGSYTIIAQTAAEMMGVPLDKVVVRLGDSAFPVSCGSGGQWGAQQLDLRRLCRLRQAARGRGAEARLQRRRRGVRGRPGPLGQSQRAARPRPRARAASSPRTRSSSATSTRSTSSRPSARISSKSASTPQPARSACGACSRSARRAASSIPSRRAAR